MLFVDVKSPVVAMELKPAGVALALVLLMGNVAEPPTRTEPKSRETGERISVEGVAVKATEMGQLARGTMTGHEPVKVKSGDVVSDVMWMLAVPVFASVMV